VPTPTFPLNANTTAGGGLIEKQGGDVTVSGIVPNDDDSEDGDSNGDGIVAGKINEAGKYTSPALSNVTESKMAAESVAQVLGEVSLPGIPRTTTLDDEVSSLEQFVDLDGDGLPDKHLDTFEGEIREGNIETMLRAVKESNSNAFNKLADDYLTTLAKVDSNAFNHVLGNTFKTTVQAMISEARRTQNEVLQNAAIVLNQFIFGNSEFQPPSRLSTEDKSEKNEREDKIAQREREFTQKKFESTRDDLNNRVNNTLKNTIRLNIDPKESMSDYVRRNAEREVMESLESAISQDTRFKILIDKLWNKAVESDFSRESVDRIRSAFLSKAKTLLPSVIKKARNEALRGMGKRVREDTPEEETSNNNSKKSVSSTPREPSTSSSNKKLLGQRIFRGGCVPLTF